MRDITNYKILDTIPTNSNNIQLEYIPNGYTFWINKDDYINGVNLRINNRYKNQEDFEELFYGLNDINEWTILKTNGSYTTDTSWKKSKTTVVHNKCGRVEENNTYNLTRKSKKCISCSKLNSNTFIDKLNSEPDYTQISDYTGDNNQITLQHNCGLVFETTPNDFKRNPRCPSCDGNVIPYKYTIEDIRKMFIDVQGNNIEYELISDEYIDNKSKLTVRYIPRNHIYTTTWSKFQQGERRTKSNTKSEEEYIKDFYIVNDPNEYELIQHDNGMYLSGDTIKNSNILVKHKLCGKILERTALYGTRYGISCNSCSTLNDELIMSIIEEESDIELVSKYKGFRNTIDILHKECGTIHTVYPTNFIRGSRCPNCRVVTRSEGEKELFDYIQSIYSGELISNYRLDDKELDIYLPDMQIGFEYDGLYWHSDELRGKYNIRDKREFFKDHNIRTIHIFEDEWYNKADLLKNKIKHILGLSDDKVYARKTKVYLIENDEKREFLNSNHIQGSTGSSINYGLKYGDELVALITLSIRKTFDKKNKNRYEIVRYATSKNVVGGFMKLLKHFINNHGNPEIVSYADLRYTDIDNNVYLTNGFELENVSIPNYYYIPTSPRYTRLHRAGFMKHKIKERFPDIYDDSKTEYEMMRELKYNRIHDAGNAVYVYNKQ